MEPVKKKQRVEGNFSEPVVMAMEASNFVSAKVVNTAAGVAASDAADISAVAASIAATTPPPDIALPTTTCFTAADIAATVIDRGDTLGSIASPAAVIVTPALESTSGLSTQVVTPIVTTPAIITSALLDAGTSSQPTPVSGDATTSTEPFPAFPMVEFANSTQRERFLTLSSYPMQSTCFLSQPDLETLGILDHVVDILVGTGISGLATLNEFTYTALTLEFFSSYDFDVSAYTSDGTSHCITFRLFNKPHSLTLHEFGDHLGLSSTGDHEPPRKKLATVLWPAISPSSTRKGGSIHFPHIRYWQRLVGETIFARPEPNNVNVIELEILAGFLNIDSRTPFVLNIAYLTAQHFNSVRDGFYKAIIPGGLVTLLARKLVTPFPADLVALDSNLLDLASMNSMHWIRKDYETWKVSPSLTITLPDSTLPRLTSLPEVKGRTRPPIPSYLITSSTPSTRERGETSHAAREARGSSDIPRETITPTPQVHTSTPVQPGLPANFVLPPSIEVPAVMDHGRLCALMGELCDRTVAMHRDIALALFPIYEAHVSEGRPIPAGWPHPSFYRYPEGGYPESESEVEEDPAVAEARKQREERAAREEARDPTFQPPVEELDAPDE